MSQRPARMAQFSVTSMLADPVPAQKLPDPSAAAHHIPQAAKSPSSLMRPAFVSPAAKRDSGPQTSEAELNLPP